MKTNLVTLEEIKHAEKILKGNIIKTPLIFSPTFSEMVNAKVYLKLENLQNTGSFKIRGATYKLILNRDNISPKGVVAASAGNHAQGVARAATQAGIPATIVMPEWASISKQEATAGYGGDVVIKGKSLEESLSFAKKLAKEGKTLVHPFDDRDIIIGQGTIALEILTELKQVNSLLVPIGGGGLISGIAAATKALQPNAKVIGVEAVNCPSAYQSLKEGKVKKINAGPSIADGISVKQIGKITFKHIRSLVDDIVFASEGDIARAMLMLLERKKTLAEGSGAIALAALLNGSLPVKPKTTIVLIVSGGNVDSHLLGRIINHGLVNSARIMHIQVQIDDTPGSLSNLLSIVANLQANVLNVFHDRTTRGLRVFNTQVDLELETRGVDHIDTISQKLKESGYLFEFKQTVEEGR